MDSSQLIESTHLGHRVEYPQHYAPEMLVGVPRQLNRTQYGLSPDKLPFVGTDSWHAYELSFLTLGGLPVEGILKLVYPASSPCLVESKSLKLYLNSFNMDRFGATPSEGVAEVQSIIQRDLSAVVGERVSVNIFSSMTHTLPFTFSGYSVLEAQPWAARLQITAYNEAPSLLEPGFRTGTTMVASHLLRSNCKITHQPDWGSVYIRMVSDPLPTDESLLRYIISIRNENHFHEEICEMIYTRLWDIFHPQELVVTCVYTRRGGIDICPSRASRPDLLPRNLSNVNILTEKLGRQ